MEKQLRVTYVDMDSHNRPLHSCTHTFIHYLKREEFSLSSWVAPVADIGLAGDSGSDGPPIKITK